MKKLSVLLIVMCLVSSIFAGGSSETPVAPADAAAKAPIDLKVWVGELYVDATAKMIESFKARYPEETFNITIGIESESTCKDTILTDPEAAADVFTFADDQLLDLVNAGAIQEVLVNADGVKSANGEGAVAAATVNGKLYAYPMSASNGYFLYYDARFFSEDDVKSFNTMVEKAASAGKKVGMQFGVDGGWYLYGFFKGAGLEMVINEDGTSNSCNWNSARGVEVAQGILDLVASGAFVADSTSNLVSAAADGNVVALVDGTWDSNPIMDAFKEGYACAKLPTFKVAGEDVQTASFAGYKLIGVNPHSKNVGWAMRLADWLTNEENQVLRFQTNGDGPSNVNAAADDAVRTNPAIAALATQSQYATVQRVAGGYWTPAATLGTILSQGNPEKTDLLKLLDTAVAGITAPSL